ncbi:MAG: hypothetical protein NTX49_01845 [Chlamydiae bacterium]|nr:hypothetical protein [Chlamydiota bacterium]
MATAIGLRLTQQGETGLIADRNVSTQQSSVFGRLWTVYSDAMSDGPDFLKNMFKLTSATTFFAKFFYPAAPQGVSNVGALAKNAKNAISVIGIPIAISKLWNSIASFKFNAPVKSTLDVGGSVCSLVNSGCDAAEFTHAVAMPLPDDVMQVVKIAGPTATLLGSVKATYETVIKLMKNSADYAQAGISTFAKEKITQQVISNSLGLISLISYVALGALCLVSALLTPIAPVAIIACLTVGTAVSLGKFFYDRVVDPTSDRARNITSNAHFPRAVELETARLTPAA